MIHESITFTFTDEAQQKAFREMLVVGPDGWREQDESQRAEIARLRADAEVSVKRIAALEAALTTAARRFDLLALADNGLRNGVIPSVGASECRAALAQSDRQHKRPGGDSGP